LRLGGALRRASSSALRRASSSSLALSASSRSRFFAFLGFGLGAAAGAFFLALLLFLGAAGLFLGLAGLRGLQAPSDGAQAPRRGCRLVALAALGVLRSGGLGAGLGHHDALALRFHDDALGAPTAEKLWFTRPDRAPPEGQGVSFRPYRSCDSIVFPGGPSAVCLAQALQFRGTLYNTRGKTASGKRAMYHTLASECQTQFPGRQDS
jgi:hypothetical protein